MRPMESHPRRAASSRSPENPIVYNDARVVSVRIGFTESKRLQIIDMPYCMGEKLAIGASAELAQLLSARFFLAESVCGVL